MHIHRTQERRAGVRYYIGGHRVLIDVLPVSQAMRCRAYISSGEALCNMCLHLNRVLLDSRFYQPFTPYLFGLNIWPFKFAVPGNCA